MTILQPAERIDIDVLADNVSDSLSSTPGFVTREWTRLQRRGMRLSGAALCCATHGLALLITAHTPRATHGFLFDGGLIGPVFEHNGVALGVAFGAIEAAMLSHGHWDHAGGLPRALGLITAANGGRAVPLYLHPAMFGRRGQRQPDGGVLPSERVPTPQEWSEFGAEPIVTTEPLTCLDDLYYVSGEIPRLTPYEIGVANQVRDDGAGWQPDPFVMDERFLALHLRGKGLVVFSACSHAGIVNVLQQARASFPGMKLHAVMGGLHLAGATEAAIPETVRGLAAFDLDLIIPGHCTGWRALHALVAAFGEPRVVPFAVGKRFSL